jgi:phage replication O-like protein O
MNDTIKPFQDISKNFTQVHNFLFDEIMPLVPSSAWKVLCFIIRKTYGWHKAADKISFSQIQAGTGIKNRTTIVKAIEALETAKYIIVHRPDDNKTPNTYALNVDYEVVQKSYQGGGTEIVPGVVQKSYHPSTKNGHTKETNQKIEEILFVELVNFFNIPGRFVKNQTARIWEGFILDLVAIGAQPGDIASGGMPMTGAGKKAKSRPLIKFKKIGIQPERMANLKRW